MINDSRNAKPVESGRHDCPTPFTTSPYIVTLQISLPVRPPPTWMWPKSFASLIYRRLCKFVSICWQLLWAKGHCRLDVGLPLSIVES